MGDGVYAIAGGKGGVGKTTTAINLGVVLGQAGYEVVVVDADLAMADVGRQLNVDHGQGLHSVLAEETAVREAVVEGPGGLAVIPGDRDLASFADADPDRLRRVFKLLGIAYDVVLVDTAPGLQNEAVITYQEVDGVVLVTTPEPNAVADMEKTGRLAADVGADLLGAVVTHSEGRRAREAASELDGDLLGVVPHHTTGGPITADAPGDAAADAYREIGAALPAVDATAVVPEETAGTADNVPDADRSGTGSDEATAGTGSRTIDSTDTETDGSGAASATAATASTGGESSGDSEADGATQSTAEADDTGESTVDTDRDGTDDAEADDAEPNEQVDAEAPASAVDESDETAAGHAEAEGDPDAELAAEIPRATTAAGDGSPETAGNGTADDETDVLELVDDAVETAQDVDVDHVDEEIESAADEADRDEREASRERDEEPEVFDLGSGGADS